MISFTLPYPDGQKAKTAFCRRFGLNAYYGGKHWAARKTDAEYIHTLTYRALRKARLPKGILDHPVEIRFLWDDGLDIDNHAALGKMIVDALKGYLLKDDDPHRFRKVSHEYWNGGVIWVEIIPYVGPDDPSGRKEKTNRETTQNPL